MHGTTQQPKDATAKDHYRTQDAVVKVRRRAAVQSEEDASRGLENDESKRRRAQDDGGRDQRRVASGLDDQLHRYAQLGLH